MYLYYSPQSMQQTNEIKKDKLELPAIRWKSETAKEICVAIVGETAVEPLRTLDGR